MAACAATRHLKIQNQPTSVTATAKPKRRKCREIIISSSGAAADTPTPPSPPARLANPDPDSHSEPNFHRGISSNTSQASYQKAEFSPSRQTNHSTPPLPPMEFSYSPSNGALYDVACNFPSGFTKFNSALTAGLLNPMSPPPPIARSSPTLFEMMVNEPDPHSRGTPPRPPQPQPNSAAIKHHQNASFSAIRERHIQMQQRIAETLGNRSPGNLFNDSGSSDIKLTLSDKDGFSVGVSVHRQILVANSSFFAGRLSERWTKQQDGGAPFEAEISDCDDVEVYVETLRLMYCKDLRRMLMKEDVPKVLGILKISAAIGFNAGVFSCLEYLEAAPWAEDEEEKITSLLSELRLEDFGASEVLKRVFIDFSSSIGNNDTEDVLKKLLQVVLEGKDEKARREMKGLFLKMLRENTTHNDISKESLYLACEGCLHQLKHHFLQAAAASNLQDVSQIARQADNLHWLLDILIDRQIAEEFVKIWASQTEMSNAHHKVPSVHRFEVSRVTARLFVGIGKGQLLASHDSRFLLLKTWLIPFYDDFGWMKRASNGLDRHVIEDGLSNTILTLPLSWQQEILLAWFDRFLNSGEDCPNIQRGFEVWWRRAFWRRNCEHERSRVRITNGENL